MDTIEGNIIIATYIGKARNFDCETVYNINNELFHSDSLMFHSSWEWLMPVVKRIKDSNEWDWWYSSDFEAMRNALLVVNIYDVWLACIDFIKKSSNANKDNC